MSLLPGPATIVRYIRRYVITEYVITGLYCTKNRLLHTLVFSIASYGSECWVLNNMDKKKIEAFELWC